MAKMHEIAMTTAASEDLVCSMEGMGGMKRMNYGDGVSDGDSAHQAHDGHR